ncbi:MAG: hypothetical protein SVW02_00725 [Candidatus Nanohaloarchaea archaeon]|nr:hypothetical protein [Candidatus Nanohaloarchaea archaeon]
MSGEVVSAAIILAFTAFAGIFAYLNRILPDDAAPLMLLNYSLIYFMPIPIAFMGIQALNTGKVATGTLENWVVIYIFIVALVFYHFVTGYYENIWKEASQ